MLPMGIETMGFHHSHDQQYMETTTPTHGYNGPDTQSLKRLDSNEEALDS